MSSTLKNGQTLDLPIDAGKILKAVAVSGSYTATIVAGASQGVIATAATGGTYGPYAGGVVIRLASSASSEVDFDVAVTPVIVSDTQVLANIDPLTGGLTYSAGGVSAAGIRDDGVAAPIGNVTAAVGSAGALTGAYYYTAIFVTEDGLKSAPWSGTATVVNPSSQQVNLTSIPVSADSKVSARWIYRTPATPVDPKDYRFVAVIADNTTTTYTDNLIDGSLGDPIDWLGSANGITHTSAGRVMAGLGAGSQALAIGIESGGGYATVAVGYQALTANTSGRRNTAVGVYASSANTSGYQNTTFGTHAGGGITVSYSNTMIGYAAGGASADMGFANTAVGDSTLGGSVAKGDGNTAIGYRALSGMVAPLGYCIAIGYAAGKYANNNRQVFIDGADRGNITNCQDVGLIYGKHESTAVAQRLHFNAITRVGPPSLTVATLPAVTGLTGFRAFVTDASATTFASIVAGGGANGVPVFCDGTNWRIG
jgi:hypothetical protein